MKVRELTVIIANMGTMAASLGQMAMSAHRTIDDEKVVTVTADNLAGMSEKLLAFCNALGELIPDVELEFDDASHRNDQ